MKTCPFCKAELEENARFCLYCMAQLDEKSVITAKKKKSRLIWTGVLAFAVLTALILIFTLKDKDQTEDAFVSSEAADTGDTSVSRPYSSEEESVSVDESQESSIIESSVVESSVVESSVVESSIVESSVVESSIVESSIVESSIVESSVVESSVVESSVVESSVVESSVVESSAVESSIVESSIVESSIVESSIVESSIVESSIVESSVEDSSVEDSSVEDSSEDTSQPKKEIKYIYRDAVVGDDWGSISTENAITIIGVETVSADGTYVIPDTIDGKRVLAVASYAFSDEKICGSVKKVIVAESVKNIHNYAFKNCNNMTDIYLKSEAVAGSPLYFLPDLEARKNIITLHASATCHDRDHRIYKSTYSYYELLGKPIGIFEEWNGLE